MKNAFIILVVIFSAFLVFGDTSLDTTTADFSAGTMNGVQAINDSVQISGQTGWWQPSAGWPASMSAWQYRKAITIENKITSLSDYQLKVVNPVYDETGLAGSWHFDETAGTTAVDMSGNVNNGSLGSLFYVNDDPSSAMLSQSGLSAFTAANVVDNSTASTAWHTDSAVAGAWLQIDLGGGNEKSYVGGRIYANAAYNGVYNVQYSDNGSTWYTVCSNFGPFAASGWNEKTWDPAGVHRYWRLYLANAPGVGPWLTELEMFKDVSAHWSAGRVGNGLAFDGIDDYVNVPDTSSLRITGAITLGAWIKLSAGSSNRVIVSKHDNGGLISGYRLLVTSSGNISFRMYNGSSNGYNGVINVADNNWHHIAGSWDGSTATIYVDGQIDGTPVNFPGTIGTDAIPVNIGAEDSGLEPFAGSIDEVRIYNRALSAAEIQLHYNAKAKLNYGDVRFVNSAGTTEFPYWMEKDGLFWVKASGSNSIPAGLSNIYMYYGNTIAVSQSNMTNTFIFGDDFSSGAIDDTKWLLNTFAPANYTITGGILKVWSDGASYKGLNSTYTTGPSDLMIIETQYKTEALNNMHQYFEETNNRFAIHPYMVGTTGPRIQYRVAGGAYLNGIQYTTASTNTWYINRIDRQSAGIFRAYTYNTGYSQLGTDTQTQAAWDTVTFRFGYSEYSNVNTYYDWVRVRKYASVEPSVYIGSEASQSALWSYRKPLTVTNAGTALTDYQLKITNPVYDETGLAGSWHFDGVTNGTIANGTTYGLQDSSGNRNNGTSANTNGTGMAWTTGKNTGAIAFDGVDDNVNVGNNGTLSLTSAWSLEAWVNPSAVDSQFHEIIRKDGTGGAAYLLQINSANKFSVNFYNGTAWQSANGTTTPVTGNWYHVAGTWNGSALAIYVNGIVEDSGIKTGTPVTPSSNTTIGGLTASRYFNGKIDEVRIYNIELPQSVISAHYASKAGLNYSDLRFTDNSGFELPYWTEKDGLFWIKMGSIPAGTTTLYAYYGNVGASNPVAKLENFFDTVDWNAFKANWKFSGNIANRVSGWESQLTQFNYDTSSWSNADISTDYVPETNAARWFVRKEFFIKAGTITYSGVVDDDEVWSLIYGDSTYVKIGGDETDADGLNAHNWVSRAFTVNADGRFIWAGRGQEGGGGDYFEITSVDSGISSIFTRKTSTPEPSVSAGTEEIPYLTSGTFRSAKKDTGGTDAIINSISWTVSGSGVLSMRIRASNSDPASWGADSNPDWEIVSNGDASIASIGRYMQYKADFTGSGLTEEPVLSDVTITYTVPITPPADSVSCDKFSNTWYSSAVFTFTNDTGFGAEIDRYYYAWDNTASYTFTLGEPVWDSSTPQLQNSATADGSWYFHYKPYSSTNTEGIAQDIGPFKYDGTAPSAVTLASPANNDSLSDTITTFSWDAVTDLSGIVYILQLDNYTIFSSPIVNKINLTDTTYALNGTGSEVLIGNTTYYWRVVAMDGAGNTADGGYRKFTTTSSVPQMINESTGESYPDIQSAIDSVYTVDGDVIDVKDTISHNENVIISKNIILENAILSPSGGFAITGQGLAGGEILRNCVITKGGVSNLALGENLTLFNPDPSAALTIENSKLVNCLIENGATITNSTLENCYVETTSNYFANAGVSDFNLTADAIYALDKGKNLSTYFTDDIDGNSRGIDILEMDNFDAGAWDIGAYEFSPGSFYLTQPEPDTPAEEDPEPEPEPEPEPGPAPDEEPAPPSAPILNIPADGAQDTEIPVVLGWYAAAGSGSITYTLHWSTNEAFTSGVNMLSGIVTIYHIVNDLSYNGTVYWRVKAVNDYGESSWSNIRSFTTKEFPGNILAEQLPPGAPILIEPLDNYSAGVLPVVFRWYPALGTGDTQYHIQISAEPDFDTVVIDDSSLLKNTYELTDDLDDTRYYWRVRASNANGFSLWSNTWTFKIAVSNANYSGITPVEDTQGTSGTGVSSLDEETSAKACFLKKLK